jgi:hypothetical protein
MQIGILEEEFKPIRGRRKGGEKCSCLKTQNIKNM